MRLSPLRWYGPVDPNDTGIVGSDLGIYNEKLRKSTVRSLIEQPTQFLAKPLSAQGNYGDKYQACSSRVLHLFNSVEILPKVASGKEQVAASVNTFF